MSKMSIQIILKNGAGFTVKCDSFTLKRNGLRQVTGYDIEGITENKPVYLDFEQVAAIVRTFSDEIEEPVGRCGECALWKEEKECPGSFCCTITGMERESNDFCSEFEPREE